MNKKSGLSLTSIIIYVALFFIFTVFAIAMSSNMNYKAMQEKADMYIYEQFDKLQYNLLASAKDSTSADNIYEKIVFSNNDEYLYDSQKKVVLKNGGVLIKNVERFEILQDMNVISNVPQNFGSNIDSKAKYMCLEITFKKYGVSTTKQIFFTVGDDISETK